MARLWREVPEMPVPTGDIPVLEKRKGDIGDVGFVRHGIVQMHIVEKDVMAGFRSGQIVNPVSHGHIAYRCDDIEAVKAELDAKGVPYSDRGERAVEGWHQIFFHDPDGNVIEIYQKKEA